MEHHQEDGWQRCLAPPPSPARAVQRNSLFSSDDRQLSGTFVSFRRYLWRQLVGTIRLSNLHDLVTVFLTGMQKSSPYPKCKRHISRQMASGATLAGALLVCLF